VKATDVAPVATAKTGFKGQNNLLLHGGQQLHAEKPCSQAGAMFQQPRHVQPLMHQLGEVIRQRCYSADGGYAAVAAAAAAQRRPQRPALDAAGVPRAAHGTVADKASPPGPRQKPPLSPAPRAKEAAPLDAVKGEAARKLAMPKPRASLDSLYRSPVPPPLARQRSNSVHGWASPSHRVLNAGLPASHLVRARDAPYAETRPGQELRHARGTDSPRRDGLPAFTVEQR
jgi:hypothetical protein